MNSEIRQQIAAAVVLYNPDAAVQDNIKSYLSQVGHLFVIDNSETPDTAIVQQIASIPGVTYHACKENLGIATALNIGARFALQDNYRYLLTMDQDSRAEPKMVSLLYDCFAKLLPVRAAIVAAAHVTKPGSIPLDTAECRQVSYVMTSGNLLDLDAYKAAGPFREDLFIDFVDVEYCLRLNTHGFPVFQTSSTSLEHKVGDLVKIGFARFSFHITSHSPVRMYYKSRNRFFVSKLYCKEFPALWWQDKVRFVLELGRLLLFEPMKSAKLIMAWRGWRDFRRGFLGKYHDEWT